MSCSHTDKAIRQVLWFMIAGAIISLSMLVLAPFAFTRADHLVMAETGRTLDALKAALKQSIDNQNAIRDHLEARLDAIEKMLKER